ncbi:hypothetical protein B0J17DRAFT_688588 [Rhizoctonia solani]|nr:hypothetical protein B0J17DRAFT_688588 [Rhizoctonia solani]
MKAKVYPDWISCHGPRGHRHVKSWDATTLVKRANSFLLDVLKYQPPESEYPGSDLHACLPEVSEGFMAHNGLESAARDGVLRVKVPGSGLNHVSSLPNPDWTTETIYTDWAAEPDNTEWESGLPSTFTPTSQLDSNTLDTTQQDSTNNAQMASTYAWVAQYPSGPGNRGAAVSNPGRDAFKTTPGFTYFMIDEEFEAIPLMCFLATTCVTIKKAVLFFRIAGCQTQYKRLIERITGWRVFVRESTESEQPSEEGVSNFVQFSEPAILLLNFRTRVLPSALHNVPLGFCVHWASTLGGQTTPRQVKRHQDCLMSQSTSIILTSERATRSATALADCDFKEHPSSVDLLYQYDSPWLSDMRAAIRSVLSGDLKFVQELYEAHLRNLRKNSSTLSTEEIASRINKFTANVLLRGEVEDGSTKYPPIAGRLATPASIIEELNLQFAVDAGMLYVS